MMPHNRTASVFSWYLALCVKFLLKMPSRWPSLGWGSYQKTLLDEPNAGETI